MASLEGPPGPEGPMGMMGPMGMRGPPGPPGKDGAGSSYIAYEVTYRGYGKYTESTLIPIHLVPFAQSKGMDTSSKFSFGGDHTYLVDITLHISNNTAGDLYFMLTLGDAPEDSTSARQIARMTVRAHERTTMTGKIVVTAKTPFEFIPKLGVLGNERGDISIDGGTCIVTVLS